MFISLLYKDKDWDSSYMIYVAICLNHKIKPTVSVNVINELTITYIIVILTLINALHDLCFDLAALLGLISFTVFPFSLHTLFSLIWYDFCLFTWALLVQSNSAICLTCRLNFWVRSERQRLYSISPLYQQCSWSLNYSISFSSAAFPLVFLLSMQHHTFCAYMYKSKVDWACILFEHHLHSYSLS